MKKENYINANAKDIKTKYFLTKKIVGKGAYSCVVKCYPLTNKEEIRVCKVIPKNRIINLNDMRSELEILSALDHPNIVKLYEWFEDSKCIYMVMEMLKGGALFERIVDQGYLDENVGRKVFIGIVRSLNYCHKQNIVHRDLKPENFMTIDKKTWDVKMIDFGLAKNYQKKNDILTTQAGTPYYTAPEVLKGNYDHRCDIWSAGVILFIILSGSAPFDGKNDAEIYRKVASGNYSMDGEGWTHISQDAKDLVSACLQVEPAKRLKAEEILNHKWMKTDDTGDKPLPKTLMGFLSTYTKFSKFKKIIFTYLAMISDEQDLKELRRCFERIDSDGDGVLTFEEITLGLSKLGIDTDVEQMREMFMSIDMDNNGYVEYTEFLAAMMDHRKLVHDDKKLSMAFSHIDIDNSGFIEKNELIRILGCNNEPIVDEILCMVDSNGDGKISFDEFKSLLTSDVINI